MTIIALPGRFAMVTRFALRDATTHVTEAANIKGIGVGEGSGDIGPCGGRYAMAVFADIRGIGMATRFSLRDTPIMTTDTSAYDLIMV
jgi:hypothetical protein